MLPDSERAVPTWRGEARARGGEMPTPTVAQTHRGA
jgi:hypothetical protein